jgi:aspartyl-tRNA(Asn)/glutamyl-tRNA(Gln) amidotransferase subunit C
MEIKDVEKLAEMARIDLSMEEKQAVLKDMDGILAYIKSIQEAEVEDVFPEYEIKNVWREDEVLPHDFSKEAIVNQFPDQERGFLKVKKIL